MAKTKKGKNQAIILILKEQSPKRRNLNDFLFTIMQQLYHHLSDSIMKVQKGRSLHDSLIKTVQQLHHHLSVLIIKVQNGKKSS